MAEETKITLQDCLAGAFQAILRGETQQRDVLCAMAEKAFTITRADTLPGDTEISTTRSNDGSPDAK